MNQSSPDRPWYHAGLRFACTGCGGCCTGAPGYVWVRSPEIAALASALGMGVEEFESQFVRRVRSRKSLIELANGDCIFFDNAARQCRVYAARPDQCRTWPFWESNLESPRVWKEVCRHCPGSGQGRLVDREEIEAQVAVVRV